MAITFPASQIALESFPIAEWQMNAAPMTSRISARVYRSARNSESEVNSNRSVSLGRQGRLDYVNFGTYVPRI